MQTYSIQNSSCNYSIYGRLTRTFTKLRKKQKIRKPSNFSIGKSCLLYLFIFLVPSTGSFRAERGKKFLYFILSVTKFVGEGQNEETYFLFSFCFETCNGQDEGKFDGTMEFLLSCPTIIQQPTTEQRTDLVYISKMLCHSLGVIMIGKPNDLGIDTLSFAARWAIRVGRRDRRKIEEKNMQGEEGFESDRETVTHPNRVNANGCLHH